MKVLRLLMLVSVITGLFGVAPASAAGSGSVGFGGVAACKDSTTVAVNATSTYANNRIRVDLYFQEKGEWKLFKQAYTSAFGAGSSTSTVSLNYPGEGASEGEPFRIDAVLQRLSGNTYVDLASASQTVSVADKYCLGKCNVVIETTDKASAAGTLAVYTHYGSWFRPEGRLQGSLTVAAGQKVSATFPGLPCGWTVRAWYYPKPRTGDKTPRLLPSQYWPNEFQATTLDVSNPYVTSFAKGLKATDPVAPNDPFAAK